MPPMNPAGALVGRDSEMTLLTGLIRQVARGRGSAVLIEGEPGIGKSALVRSAVAGAPEAGCEVFWGAGDELGQALPLLPFLDGLRVREPSANPGGTRSSYAFSNTKYFIILLSKYSMFSSRKMLVECALKGSMQFALHGTWKPWRSRC